MNWLTGSGRALYATFNNFLRPVVTEGIRAEADRSPRYRASFALVHDEHGDEACIGCQMCEKICPSQVITVEKGGRSESPNTGKKRGWHKDFTLDLQACLFCELCIQVCPADSIVMVRVQEEPAFEREDLVLTVDKLYANETSKPLYWTNGSKLVAAQNPKKGADS